MPLPSVLDEIDRLFDELIRRPWGRVTRQLVPAELHTVEDGWIVELPAEGMRAADLKLEVRDRQLTVTGYRRDEGQRRHRTGSSHTRQEALLQRTITLPAAADPDDVEAKLEGATLSIHIRKRRP